MTYREFIQKHYRLLLTLLVPCVILGSALLVVALAPRKGTTVSSTDRTLVTVFDRGVQTSFVTEAATLGEALKDNDIQIDSHDTVEPSIKEELVASNYWVNIYSARPVIVIDGTTRMKTITPYQTPQQIASDVGIQLYNGDAASLSRSTDFIGDGAGLELTITRAIPISVDLYGRITEIRTLAKTVKGMLAEKDIKLGDKGRVSVPLDTPITAGLTFRIWREGKQTITVDEAIPFDTEKVQDADRPIGYKAVSSPGKNGNTSISYEIEIKDGVEISRTEIARIVSVQPTKQVEVIGIKQNPNALTKSKGAQYFVDSRGISHRETYYDLDMGVVMQSCGQRGYYTIRFDGAKIDAEGYVIVAANYGRYPKCSIVETSMGPAKVYDTGGFAERHPEGFDLATDWTNYNGR